MSESPATTEPSAAASAIPSYETVLGALDARTTHWASTVVALTQLKTLLESISRDAESSDHPVCRSIGVLADIGIEIANQVREEGDEAYGETFVFVMDARSAIPKRAWRKCGIPSEPDDNERAEEEAFARAITGFPKRGGWDGDYTLVCVAQATEDEA